jgi:hypothetical protein
MCNNAEGNEKLNNIDIQLQQEKLKTYTACMDEEFYSNQSEEQQKTMTSGTPLLLQS